ncbi:3'-5' exoribonuclease YhaM family protein [Clostridium thermarum]|uniref:3'-5' exoribonuclease YhaM family protein n=1 Tax=Clostridium thermarum TaxID=1716543 RepID=UPI0013D0E1D4|nr:HD domain-containing protein [Clostridium thermarum]
MVNINEFEAGKRIEGFYLVRSVDCKTTNSNNKKYMDFTLSDKTGEINAKLWEVPEGEESKYSANTVIKVRGTVLAWQGSLQLKIEKIRPTTPEDKLDVSEFVPTAPYPAEEMYAVIKGYVDSIKNSDIRMIVDTILEEYKDKIMYYPAAKKNHHSIRSGLLYHVSTMLRAGEKLCEIYTSLNKDLLYAGVILHDLAKMEEMDSSELGIVSDYTIEGTLLGHIIQGIKNVEVVGQRLGADKEVIMLLQHMILSHHYEPEYGSPVKPMLPEAEILHYLDIIDARMFDMTRVTKEISGGTFSERLWSLENRRIYKPRLEREE